MDIFIGMRWGYMRASSYRIAAEFRADLKRLKRDSESSQLPAISSGEVRLPETKSSRRTTPFGKYAAIAGVVVAALALAMFFTARGGRAMTEKDTILLSDLVNTTADPVFD